MRPHWFFSWLKLLWSSKKVLSSKLVDDDFKRIYIKIRKGKIMDVEISKLIEILEGYVSQKAELDELRPKAAIFDDVTFQTAYTAAVAALPQQ